MIYLINELSRWTLKIWIFKFLPDFSFYMCVRLRSLFDPRKIICRKCFDDDDKNRKKELTILHSVGGCMKNLYRQCSFPFVALLLINKNAHLTAILQWYIKHCPDDMLSNQILNKNTTTTKIYSYCDSRNNKHVSLIRNEKNYTKV